MWKQRPIVVFGLVVCGLLGIAVVNSGIGDVMISIQSTWDILTGQGDPDEAYILIHYRAPRIVVAILVGGALAVAGVIMQTVVNNPLAAPDTLGVSGGAALAALFLTGLFPTLSFLSVSVVAFLGGMLAACFVYFLTYKNGTDPVKLALIGVSVSALCGSGVELALLKMDTTAQTSLLWLNGSLFGSDWEQVWLILPLFFILVLILFGLVRVMDTLLLGQEVSVGLGVSVEKVKLVLLVISTLLTATSVSVVGMIGFVGLISPHIARQLVGGQHRYLLPMAMLVGPFILLLADTIGRSVIRPIEIPAGIVTSLLGAPYFLYLMYKESRYSRP